MRHPLDSEQAGGVAWRGPRPPPTAPPSQPCAQARRGQPCRDRANRILSLPAPYAPYLSRRSPTIFSAFLEDLLQYSQPSRRSPTIFSAFLEDLLQYSQ